MDNKEWEVSTAQLLKTHGYSTPANQRKLNQQAHEAEALARDILKLSRDTLLINLRFLEAALIRVVPEKETVTADMATDGQFLYYNSVYICRRFRKGKEVSARDYLHVVFHCLYRHLFKGKVIPELWDLACDIAVENTITNLGIKSLACERQEKQKWLIEKLREEVPRLTAEWIYRWLRDQEFPPEECHRLRNDFYADDHKIWHRPAEVTGSSGKGTIRDDAEQDQQQADTASQEDSGDDMTPPPEDAGDEVRAAGGRDDSGSKKDSEGEQRPGAGEGEEEERKGLSPEETEQMWRDISRQIEVDLDT
ncbi:MAG: hypothetical protein Q4C25_03105, partial [Bacillota bacterium]|nr:hypothetical protein [Bacillota bacterium]